MTRRLIYGIDDVPPMREALFLGFQHYLTMFGATVAIPLVLSGPLGMADDPIAIVLDNTIPGTDEERGLTAWLGQ